MDTRGQGSSVVGGETPPDHEPDGSFDRSIPAS
jgi:hypothetical protein